MVQKPLRAARGKEGQVTSVGEPQLPTAVEWPGAALLQECRVCCWK